MKIGSKLLVAEIIFLSMAVLMLSPGCGKELSFETNMGDSGMGSWNFSQEDSTFRGSVDRVTITQNTTLKEMSIDGHANNSSDSLHLYIFADTFKAGTYEASTANSAFDYGSHTPFIYSSDPSAGDFSVTITQIDDQTIQGTFSGSVLTEDGATVQINNGSFSASLKAPTTTSEGEIGGLNGSCSPALTAGAYQEGTALNTANTVTVSVTVTTPGTYHISTVPNASGVTFEATGLFAAPGVYQVTLTGSGTPATIADQEFVVQYGDSQCSFTIDIN